MTTPNPEVGGAGMSSTTHPLPIPTCCNCGTTSARLWVELDGGRWACGPCWAPFGPVNPESQPCHPSEAVIC